LHKGVSGNLPAHSTDVTNFIMK